MPKDCTVRVCVVTVGVGEHGNERVEIRVQCPKCKLVYRVIGEKIPSPGGYGVCRKCQTRIFVKKDGEDHGDIRVRDRIHCPRCGHGQLFSERCMQCGLVLAKYKFYVFKKEIFKSGPLTLPGNSA